MAEPTSPTPRSDAALSECKDRPHFGKAATEAELAEVSGVYLPSAMVHLLRECRKLERDRAELLAVARQIRKRTSDFSVVRMVDALLDRFQNEGAQE